MQKKCNSKHASSLNGYTSDLLKQDVLVEPTGMYLRRVNGVTVRKPAAGNWGIQLPEATKLAHSHH